MATNLRKRREESSLRWSMSDSASFTRAEVVAALKKQQVYDVAIVGINSVAILLTHICAFNGFRTVLLSPADFILDLETSNPVLEKLLNEKEDINKIIRTASEMRIYSKIAPHLLQKIRKPLDKLPKHAWYKRALFSLLSESRLPSRDNSYQEFEVSPQRILFEHLYAARQEGALTLNYAPLKHLIPNRDGTVDVRWQDTENKGETTAVDTLHCGVVLHCPSSVTMKPRSSNWNFSRGVISFSGDTSDSPLSQAWDGYQTMVSLSNIKMNSTHITQRLLPGAAEYHNFSKEFIALGEDLQLPVPLIQNALQRFGSRLRPALSDHTLMEIVDDEFLKIEIILARDQELGANVLDIVRNRLGSKQTSQNKIFIQTTALLTNTQCSSAKSICA